MDSGYVDAQPVREHLEMLSRYGIGHERVAELSGVSVHTIRNFRWTRSSGLMMRAIAERILKVEPSIENMAGHRSVDATGARRRLQALTAIGWTQHRLGDALEVPARRVWQLLRAERIQADTYRAIARVYETYWDVPAPTATARQRVAADAARRLAVRNGWVPPLAWDDIDTDPQVPVVELDAGELDEGELVDEIAIELACAGERVALTARERELAHAQLEERGYSAKEIARTLGIADRTVAKWRAQMVVVAEPAEGLVA
ncbi:MAG: helix-turn-helix domain-containing protein [Protaetiibacter sp.]